MGPGERCLSEFMDWRYSKSCWYFRPSFVNFCPTNLLSGSTLPPFPVSKYSIYSQCVAVREWKVLSRVQWFWLFFTFWGITTHPWHPKGPRIWKLAKKNFQLHPWSAEIFGKKRKMRFLGLVSKFNLRSPVWQIFTIFSACFIYEILNTHIKF